MQLSFQRQLHKIYILTSVQRQINVYGFPEFFFLSDRKNSYENGLIFMP